MSCVGIILSLVINERACVKISCLAGEIIALSLLRMWNAEVSSLKKTPRIIYIRFPPFYSLPILRLCGFKRTHLSSLLFTLES